MCPGPHCRAVILTDIRCIGESTYSFRHQQPHIKAWQQFNIEVWFLSDFFLISPLGLGLGSALMSLRACSGFANENNNDVRIYLHIGWEKEIYSQVVTSQAVHLWCNYPVSMLVPGLNKALKYKRDVEKPNRGLELL